MIGLKKQSDLDRQKIDRTLEYVRSYWQKLERTANTEGTTLIPLPNRYIIPSKGNKGFVFEEQYYWDTYFTCLGIDDEELVEGMLDNLLYLFKKFSLIPNANRFYFTSRSQPPILTSLIFHIFDKYSKSMEWLSEKIAIAQKEYETVWMGAKHPNDRLVHKGLSRYYDINNLHDLAEAESGWDMTPRFKRQCLDYLPVDLNCLLFKYEKDFERAANLLGNKAEARNWQSVSLKRKEAIDSLLWSKKNGFYFDYNYKNKSQSKVWSLAAYYSLWAGVADEKQAKKIVQKLEKFEKRGGLATTAGKYMYVSLFGSTKTQWAHPNGWAPLHYIVTEGLENYGYRQEAERIAKKWLKTCSDWFDAYGIMQEKYNVVNPKSMPKEGVYPPQTGFGWTNGVFVFLTTKYQ